MPCTTESPTYKEGEFGNSEHSCVKCVRHFRVKVVVDSSMPCTTESPKFSRSVALAPLKAQNIEKVNLVTQNIPGQVLLVKLLSSSG